MLMAESPFVFDLFNAKRLSKGSFMVETKRRMIVWVAVWQSSKHSLTVRLDSDVCSHPMNCMLGPSRMQRGGLKAQATTLLGAFKESLGELMATLNATKCVRAALLSPR